MKGAETLELASEVICQSQANVNAMYEKLLEEHKRLKKDAENTFWLLFFELEQRKQEYVNEVNKFWETKLNNLKKQMETMSIGGQLEEVAKAARTAATTNDPFLALQCTKNMSVVLQTSDITKMVLEPCETVPSEIPQLNGCEGVLLAITSLKLEIPP